MLHLDIPTGIAGSTKVALLGHTGGGVDWKAGAGGKGVDVQLPPAPLGSDHAWALKSTRLAN